MMKACNYCREPAQVLPLHGETLGDNCAGSSDAPFICDNCAQRIEKINPWWPRPHPEERDAVAAIESSAKLPPAKVYD